MSDTKAPNITHVVLLAARQEVRGSELERALSAVRRLNRLPGVTRLQAGPDISREGLQGGFTHAVVVEFDGEGSRDAYLGSPEHVEAAGMLSSCVDRIVVVDL